MRRKTVTWSIVALILLVVIGAAVTWFVPVFRVGSIEITGATRTDPTEVEEVSGIAEGSNLLRMDATAAATSIAALPWVESVTVNRRLPSTVQIDLVEREAAVFVRRGDGDHVIDTSGRAIIIGTPPPGSIEVRGAREDDPDVLPAVTAVLAAIDAQDPQLRTLIADIQAPDQFDISLHLTDGREIYWGSSDNNHDKAVALATVVKREGGSWNISSPSMVTVR
ncbi:cell division protein FtsQ/DivIB [Corynebacterium pacaense]|uniref:cell division protein FtsQ/DivIB n=1 Tax=Corynebacterium pacaense TaxID=1816684 RepID=UPI0009BA4E97|nr:FtsQ-type POTRA domain-containing protein [Corynebacterium pacaense]